MNDVFDGLAADSHSRPAFGPGSVYVSVYDLRGRQRISEIVKEMVSQNFASWNLISGWLARLDGLRRAA